MSSTSVYELKIKIEKSKLGLGRENLNSTQCHNDRRSNKFFSLEIIVYLGKKFVFSGAF